MAELISTKYGKRSIKSATLNTVMAVAACGGAIHVLVSGQNAQGAADAAAKVAGVAKSPSGRG